MTLDQALQVLRKDARNALAWEALAQEIYSPLLGYVGLLLVTFKVGAGETAEDIVQDALLRFYERWPEIRNNVTSNAGLFGYLKKSCRNLLVDRYREERRAESLIRFLDLKFRNAFQDEADYYRDIFLKEVVGLLPPECGALIREYVEKDLSPAEIAESQNASPATFYSRWYRCIQKARHIFLQKKSAQKRS